MSCPSAGFRWRRWLKGMTDSTASPINPLVVVVDDDAAVRNSLKFSLEIEGFAVRDFSGGADLLSAPDLRGCACFVIDQNMPGLSGLDVVAKLRDRRDLLPVILITSHPTTSLRRRAADAGVCIVEKPLLGTTLFDKIRDVIASPAARSH